MSPSSAGPATGAGAALWSVIRIPADLLPAAEAAMDTVPARPPSHAAADLRGADVAAAFRQRAAATPPTAGPSRSSSDCPPEEKEAPAAAAASQLAASNTCLLYTFIARRRLGRWGRCRRLGSRRPRWGGGARRRGGLYTITLSTFNARWRLGRWGCCRR
jgi:hypothetical protein